MMNLKARSTKQPDFLSVRAVARMAGVSEGTIRNLADAGVIQAKRLDDGMRSIRIFRPGEVHKIETYYEQRGGMRLLPKR